MKFTFLLLGMFWSVSSFAQEYRKDSRKDDHDAIYQTDQISKTDILKALEVDGVRIFKVPLNRFDKKYDLTITLAEYANGKKISAKTFAMGKGTYIHYIGDKPYFDYIDQLTFFSKEGDSLSKLNISTMAESFGGIKLKKHLVRNSQSYEWRSYSKTDWVADRDVPLFIYGSSWYDTENNIERFCGTNDLSRDRKETEELLSKSAHYYVIGYKVGTQDK